MTKNEHPVSYADQARQEPVTIDENVRIARDTYRVSFRCPAIARAILPGQFIMLRMAESNDPLLGRPFALYDTLPSTDGRADDRAESLVIVYRVVGRMTRLLAAARPGRSLRAWGPLGNGFPPTETEELLIVAGGIGQTPLLALAREYLGRRTYGDPPRRVAQAAKVTLCYGARTKDYLAGVEDFEHSGVEVHLTTDDGSAGHHGLVTELIRPVVQNSSLACRIVCCGPEPMIRTTAQIARELGLHCQVSLERLMACGMGICFSCVARVRNGSGKWDYRRSCVEGPVFDAHQIEW